MSSTTTSPQVKSRIPDHVVARWAGGLALAFIVLMLGGFALEAAPVAHGDSPSKALHTYAQVSITRTMAGGYIEALAFVVLVPALLLVARSLARRTDLGRLASQVFVGLGVALVASTLATGFPPGAAALYAAHHGVDATTVATVNDIRNYAYVLQVMLTAAMALCVGVASLVERRHTRWIGWGGIAVGALGLAATPLAHNPVNMVWMIWWVGLGVVLLREKDQRD
jgi:hypothetical protein